MLNQNNNRYFQCRITVTYEFAQRFQKFLFAYPIRNIRVGFEFEEGQEV